MLIFQIKGIFKNWRLAIFRLISGGAFAFSKENNRLFDGKKAEKMPKEMKKNMRIRLTTLRKPIFRNSLKYISKPKKTVKSILPLCIK